MSQGPLFANTSLCVVGNINRDIRTAAIRSGPHLMQDGETSISDLRETVGGGGANSAFAAATLGAKVGFLGKVGTDSVGTRLEQLLRASAIEAHLSRDSQNSTGTSIALSYDTGHRHFISCLPNNESLAYADLEVGVLSNYRHLLRADIWFSEQMLFGGNARLFAAARAAGMTISLDLNWDPHWGVAADTEVRARKEAIKALLPEVALAHGNVRELIQFTEAPDLITALGRLEKWGAGAVVVHMGEDGAGFYQNGSFVTAPAVPARTRVNTTGTGDLLSVCMILWQQLDPAPVKDQLQSANQLVTRFIEGELDVVPKW